MASAVYADSTFHEARDACIALLGGGCLHELAVITAAAQIHEQFQCVHVAVGLVLLTLPLFLFPCSALLAALV